MADAQGNLYLSVDHCTSTNFPVPSEAYQSHNGGGADAVFVKLAADLSRVLYATYLGGSGSDGSREAALASDGSFIFGGDTASADFPLRNAYDMTWNGSGDGFVARFSPPPPAITAFAMGSNEVLTLAWTDFATAYTVEFSPDLLQTRWEPIAPESQWPTSGTLWTGTHTTGDTTLFYRIRGE